MKPILKSTLFILVIILHTQLSAQNNIDSIVLVIRGEFSKIQLELKNSRSRVYEYENYKSEPKEIKFVAHYLPFGMLVKLDASFTQNNEDYKLEYYLDNFRLIFLFAQIAKNDGTKIQERIYYENEEIILALYKEKDPANNLNFEQIKNREHPFVNSGSYDEYHTTKYINKYYSYPVFESCDDNNLKIKRIKAEYQNIEVKRKDGFLKECRTAYTNKMAYWWNTFFDVFYNEKSEIVLFTYNFIDEGHQTCDSVYLKDRKPFFILRNQSFPDDGDYNIYINSQERIYLYNDTIIRILEKSKPESDLRPFEQIENIDVTNKIEDISKTSVKKIKDIDGEMWRYFKAVTNQND